MSRTWKNWTPALVAAAAIGAATLIGPLTANAAVDLPDKTPAEVLELAGNSTATAFSGTVEQTSDLGLPDLSAVSGMTGPSTGTAEPESTGSPETAALELLTGSHTARVFVDGPDQARVQVLDQLDERNIVRNGSEVWFYNSEDNSAIHATLEEHQKHEGMPKELPTPDQVADMFLEKADESTEVTVGSDQMVAGRAAYELTLTPRSGETLVGAVTISVDGETGLPLAVSVTASGDGATAFSTSFTDITFEAPSAETFDFTPPAGATVTELDDKTDRHGDKPETAKDPESKPAVTGSGWDTVVIVPDGAQDLPEMLTQLSTPVEGGQLLETTLVNVLLTDDGRMLAGSVTPERLLEVAAGQ